MDNKRKKTMVKITPFKNPPISEAVLDIRVDLSSDFGLEDILPFYEIIKEEYPEKKEISSWKGGFQVKQGSAPEILPPSGGPIGYMFKSSDGLRIVQARLNGFSFNKLKPYDNWQSFSSEAKKYWQEYIKIAKPNLVKRLALRYINKINLPLPLSDFNDYIKTFPEIAKGIPDVLSGMFLTLELVDKNNDLCARVIETFKGTSSESKVLPFIFDIDAYKVVSLNPGEDAIWKIIEELREFKNTIFYRSLTEKTKRNFNE